MKKVVICVIHNDYMSIDLGIAKYREGYDVYFVGCDKSVNFCGFQNPRGCKLLCSICASAMKKEIQKLVKEDPARYHFETVSALLNKEIVSHANNMVFNYANTKELKELTYKGVEIGYAAFSSFVSLTRNVMPSYNKALKTYLNEVLRREVLLTDALDSYFDIINPELIIFHNGRMPNCKPPYCLAKEKGISFIATERIPSIGKSIMDNFFNDVPHSYPAIHAKTEKMWKLAGEEKYEIGKAFYDNRYHSKPAGDKIYTKDQKLGMLPDGFDTSKRNIVIFNSSEDEYFSISKKFDESVLFPNQYIALKTIFERYKDTKGVHFYLRIHPNLAQVPFKSHTMLYDLKYDNVTIIPPASPISSYTLMENAEKVLVFGSTIGLESSYWGKTVIVMTMCYYSGYDVAYEPQNVTELFELIENKNLKPKVALKENYYKLAYRLMQQVGEKLKYYSCSERMMHLPFNKGKKLRVYSSFMLFGSSVIYTLTIHAIKFLSRKGVLSKYNDYYMFKTT